MSIGPLSAKQRAAWWALADSHLVILEGAVRSGKSVAADHAFVDFAVHGPPGNLLLVGRTQDTAIRNIIHPLTDVFGEAVRFNRGNRELRIHGRRVYVVGANDERAQEKIRGLTLVGAYVDESSTVPESFWTMLRTRLSAEGARMIATTNPDAPLHWLKRDWLDRAEALGIARFSFRLEDNPYLPPAYVEAVKREFVGLWYRRFIEGEWVAAEGAVYDMFDHDAHLADELPAISRWWLAIDYGTATVTHALLAGLGVDDRLHVVREWRWDAKETHKQLTDAEYSERLREWVHSGADGAFTVNGKPAPVPIDRAVVDPSAVSFNAQLRRDGWVVPREAENDVLDGIRYTATLLSSGRLRIHRSCEHLTRELAGYVWDAKAQERGVDAPVKADDHGCLVPGTIIVTARGLVPIEEIVPGDEVLTSGGWGECIASAQTQEHAAIKTVWLSDGGSLSGTGDHPVWAEGRGWVQLDALRYGDRLRTWSKSSSSRASSSVATPTPTRGQRPTTSLPARLIGSVAWGVSMRRFGRLPTERFRQATSSTTPTSTRSTTSSATFGASMNMSTAVSTASVLVSAAAALRCLLISLGCGRWLQNGTARRPVGNGTANTGSVRGKVDSRRPRRVNTAEHPSSLLWPTPGSAPTTASLPRGVLQALTMRLARVCSAESRSGPTATCPQSTVHCHVLAVTEHTERLPVYNLLISGAHDYFANGVLVHNCDALRYLAFTTRRYTRRWLAYRHEEAA